jgi:excisionase family DNA binding protein
MTPPRTPSPRFHTVAYIAKVLDVSEMTIRREITRGRLRAYRVATSLRIDARDFADYMRGAATVDES